MQRVRTVDFTAFERPHRQWNEGTAVERHLALHPSTPEAGKPLGIGLGFAPNGEEI